MHVPDLNELRSVEELQACKQKLTSRLNELEKTYAGLPYPEETREEYAEIREGIKEAGLRVQELEARMRFNEELAQRPGNTETLDFDWAPKSSSATLPPHQREARELGLRAIARNGDVLRSEASDRLDTLVRSNDPSGASARYLAAVANPHYRSVFGKLMMDPTSGHLRFSREEVEAVRVVTQATGERAMSPTNASGGFAVPFELDPTILLTSSGALNPIRQIARVFTVSYDQWKGVSSAGVVATYQAEAAAVTDASPTLAQPTIDCAMARCFVPFSIELGMDWGTLEQELARLIADARDVLDATQFLTGTGTDSPAGVLTGLTTTQRVLCAATGFPAVADHYSLKAAIPPRFLSNLTWAGHQGQWDRSYRLTPSGSTTEPQMLTAREGPILGSPKVEWSTMANVSTAGSKVLIAGDFASAF